MLDLGLAFTALDTALVALSISAAVMAVSVQSNPGASAHVAILAMHSYDKGLVLSWHCFFFFSAPLVTTVPIQVSDAHLSKAPT